MAASDTRRVFIENLGRNNPVFVQVLGICSTLAVTNVLRNTLVMCAGLIFATGLSSLTISAMRRSIPGSVRMIVEVLVIACYVIVVNLTLKAFAPDISRQLGPYVGLIITNCIVMGRAEACALTTAPWLALVDGVSSALGYTLVLATIALLRELLGSGAVWGVRVLGEWWVNWSIMVMAPGAFFMLAVLIWIVKRFWLTGEDAGCCGGGCAGAAKAGKEGAHA